MNLTKLAKNLGKGSTSHLKEDKNILWFDEIGIQDIPLVGGKNASLGEMYSSLTKLGVKIPFGFAVTANAYRFFINESGLKEKIKKILTGLNTSNLINLQEKGEKVRTAIMDASFPEILKLQIIKAYKKLEDKYRKNVDVAVRSSATAEDLPDASFAGQQETYLNIHSEEQLLHACKKCFASLFTDRAISYRVDKKFSHFDIALSIGVQKMVRSDLSSSGVMFSIDTESGFDKVAFITAAYGLGENVVQGKVNPDEYLVFKPTLEEGYKPIISKTVGEKHLKMIYDESGNKLTKNVNVPKEFQEKFAINDKEILTLAKWAIIIEDHYSAKKGKYQPMDMEWAKDGKSGELFIVQARPETVQSQIDRSKVIKYEMTEKGKIICQGLSVGSKIATGSVKTIHDIHGAANFKEGDILVTDMTDPDWEPIMKKASAIITNRGGRTCFSEDTTILTNKGFTNFKEIFEEGFEGLKVPSLNRNTLKIEWKEIKAVMRKKGNLIKINTSQTGRMKNNLLKITPDHKMINIKNAELADTQIRDIIKNQECLTLAQHLPQLNSSTQKEQALAYLLGGIMTDGHIYLRKTHGEVTFIQKPTETKRKFISKMNNSLKKIYNKDFKETKKKESSGFIRGKEVNGCANAYRCYSKSIAQELNKEKNLLIENLLNSDKELSYSFLAGVIDGDGSFNKGRVNIYISKKELLEPVIIACMRIGTVPQVTINRNIHNIQIVEKLTEIGKYTHRVKCRDERKIGTRFFNTKQLFNDNINSNINVRIKKNLLIDEKEIKNYLKNIKDEKIKSKIEKILNSDLRQVRTSLIEDLRENMVYNITIEDNHNYIVFTDRYTPILVNNCHAAIISRELGVPAVVGTDNATAVLKNGQKITVSCAEGEVGRIYQGILKYKIKEFSVKNIPETETKIMLNLGNPHLAFQTSFLPNDGVGLAREEFIINSGILIHPNALIQFDKLKKNNEAQEAIEKIEKITTGYKDKTKFYIDKLAEGIAMIGAAFYPKKVIIRFSDFKTNEYANLIGGKFFEPKEDNPMIGFRGASRYYSQEFKEAFKLECQAIKKTREEFGLKNIRVMIPFCRTVEEAKKVLAVMKEAGLEKGDDGLEVYLMCEIPSNVILADEFLKLVDGYSLGTNDLTQLTLGVDRDSQLVSHVYDERNQAVKDLVKLVIKKCKQHKKYIGICGQAPSDYPEFAKFIVEEGIESMSLNPDTIVSTKLMTAKLEKKLESKKHKKIEIQPLEKLKIETKITSKKKPKKIIKKSPIKKKPQKKAITKSKTKKK